LVDYLALWNKFKVNNNLDTKKLMSNAFICDFDMGTLSNPFMPFKNT